MGSAPLDRSFAKASLSTMERSVTTSGCVFGTSSPTKDSPGTGASKRMLRAARARARSFSLERMLSTFTLVFSSTCLFTGRPFSSRMGFPCSSLSTTSRVRRTQPGTSPNWVTTGPGLTSSTFTSTP